MTREAPRVSLSTNIADGGCMFCPRLEPHAVAIVRGNHTEARFCRACASDIGFRWPAGRAFPHHRPSRTMPPASGQKGATS